ncbi:aldo/keto reductase [Baaleninema simplex]|uniref:aldo/keto reductase n=1 Tax=Baaleninema simplex TaxID=2862350 RepID=UPI00034B743D|nr:aldo/keto reductase [Baaleninema simplex]
MSVFSCGGMRYQHSWKDLPQFEIPKDSQHNLEANIHRSIELGINHLETARMYGTSEIQIGQILPKFPRDKIIVQTKVLPTEDPLEFRENLKQSLQNLQLEFVDLLAIHGINTPELLAYTLRPGGCLDEARKFQKQGRVRYIGFSTHGSPETIVQTIESGEFDYVNLHWYYINQSNWPAIEAARRHDMGVFIISPSNKGGMLYKPPTKLTELCRPLSPMVFNDLFCLSRSEVHTLSLGAARPSDFEEHLKVLPLLSRVEEVLLPILDRLERAAIEALGEQWYKTWHFGLPNFDETPGQVNVPVILWLRNLAVAYDLVEYGKMRYNLLGNGSHWFPGQKAENLDLQLLRSSLANSPHAEIIPKILQEADELLGGQEVKRLSQQ